MNIPENLIEKYNKPLPRYTSYPPANFFGSDFDDARFRAMIAESNSQQPQNISLYFHIPFCPQLCYYCGCNSFISNDNALKTKYINALKSEIRMMRPLLNRSRKVSQIHWGGGTPNALSIHHVEEVMELVSEFFSFVDNPEIAMECAPAYLDSEYLEQLLAMKFNRISLGIQDFSPQVLKTVNREPSKIPISVLIGQIRESAQAKINLDFIYGLPKQTTVSFAQTIAQALQFQPDRLVTFSYAHLPGVKKSQALLEKSGLPTPSEKLEMFTSARRLIEAAGYAAIGLDHFAKKTDELAIALHNKQLHRNFQGYCTRETTGQVVALGTTAISQFENGYAQNTKDVEHYIEAISNGRFAAERGYRLSGEQQIIRRVIQEIMCNRFVAWPQLSTDMGISVEEIMQATKFEKSSLDEFISDNLVEVGENYISVTETGSFFIRNIAALFDPAVKKVGKVFSKTI
ncbi:MAG: oxygen-independent coproporphyrinogen III oxidase [Prolixibacteraceae bacterium]|nr:oxygen-independent coproporphyrinogen III oxidase [Prolixibacteraceae bacterium]